MFLGLVQSGLWVRYLLQDARDKNASAKDLADAKNELSTRLSAQKEASAELSARMAAMERKHAETMESICSQIEENGRRVAHTLQTVFHSIGQLEGIVGRTNHNVRKH
jgi:DNA anti-recombination protein RmuC